MRDNRGGSTRANSITEHLRIIQQIQSAIHAKWKKNNRNPKLTKLCLKAPSEK